MRRKLDRSRSADGATAFAPGTVANVAVGFDVLGFALVGIGDRVTAKFDPEADRPVTVERVSGVVTDLPTDPERNTASVAVAALLGACQVDAGLRLTLRKGIPLGSGMGGSAASAVAGVVAVNALLDRPLPTAELLPFALAGEAAASGAPHADNAAPSLFGGMTAIVAHDPPHVVDIPLPAGVSCVLVRPALRIDTRDARASLAPAVPLERVVEQSMSLTGFLAGCFRNDVALIGRSFNDLIAGPQRAVRIPGFDDARSAAERAGALGLAIAGSGPSVFAWVPSGAACHAVERAVRDAFARHGLETDGWISPLGCPGARIEREAT
ncbi:MAG TPA: homoserine kinase [Candidatus Polarisedimenticolaceae bacterium]|nr:homoserine kinase [Candidatus Polarisedimenticolaceae bacterium]